MLDLFNQAQNNSILSASTYADFRRRLVESACRQCPLHRNRTHIVADRGNPEADVLFIGEAPGENEDLQGRAFVGRAGRLLDSMLDEMDFDTNRDALIVNINKCRPPDNRRPTAEEVEACRPFLRKQMELVKPRLIGLLGATALKSLFPEYKKAAMGSEVGKFFGHPSRPDAKFIVLYHPAYILRDPRKKPLMQQHLKLLVEEWERGR